MTSNGTAAGFFAGVVDEARVWNVVRSGAQILASRDQELTSGSGLIGRWGLNEASGTTATNSVSGGVNGTLVGGPTRVPGFVAATDDDGARRADGARRRRLATARCPSRGRRTANPISPATTSIGGPAPGSPTGGTPLNGGTLLTLARIRR